MRNLLASLLLAMMWAGPVSAHTAPTLWTQPDHLGAPEVHGLHLQFGSDAAREVGDIK